jgi:hypothetical protein
VLFGIRQLHHFVRAGVVAAEACGVLGEAPLDIGRDARVVGAIRALEHIDEVHRLRIDRKAESSKKGRGLILLEPDKPSIRDVGPQHACPDNDKK